MDSNTREIINLEDFKTLHLKITFENQTTKTSVFENRRVFPKGKGEIVELGHFPVRLVELLDRGFKLDLPSRSCSVGHVLKVHIETENTPAAQPAPKAFSFIAKAKEPADHGDKKTKTPQNDRQVFDFDIIQFEEEVWNDFMSVFETRQNEILELFASIKGY